MPATHHGAMHKNHASSLSATLRRGCLVHVTLNYTLAAVAMERSPELGCLRVHIGWP